MGPMGVKCRDKWEMVGGNGVEKQVWEGRWG